MFDSIIFDMDGTLIDTVKEIQESWNLSITNNGWEKELSVQDIKSIMGLNPADMSKVLFPTLDVKEGIKRVLRCTYDEIFYLEEHKGKCYIPNKKFIKELAKKYKLFIVSNCMEGYIEVFYKNFKYKKYFVDYQNASNGKTKGQNIRFIVDKYNLKNPVYVGDTLGDYNATIEANVPFIHAAYGFGKVENVNKINSIEELLNYE